MRLIAAIVVFRAFSCASVEVGFANISPEFDAFGKTGVGYGFRILAFPRMTRPVLDTDSSIYQRRYTVFISDCSNSRNPRHESTSDGHLLPDSNLFFWCHYSVVQFSRTIGHNSLILIVIITIDSKPFVHAARKVAQIVIVLRTGFQCKK